MEKGLSFLEFNYMIMQSYDFYDVVPKIRTVTCSLAETISGAICLAEHELIRRKLGKDACAMTITLASELRRKENGQNTVRRSMAGSGKDVPIRVLPVYWRNVADADVFKCSRMLTFLPLEAD